LFQRGRLGESSKPSTVTIKRESKRHNYIQLNRQR
jgi:hypothetical protein